MSESLVSRIKPVLGLDNKWWWDQAAEGVLAIQRCQGCQSQEWDFISASGKGTVCSFTVLHHPKFPGYDYPLIIVLVELAEGTRITSQLTGCEPDEVDFDMPVEMVMQRDADGFQLPYFRPSQ